MAQLTTTSISINGRPIRQFSSFSLSQGIYEHHSFRLTCPARSLEGISGGLFNQSKELIGVQISVQVDTVGIEGQLRFKGIITQVQAERYSGSSGDIIISGSSATILLDNGPHCKSWEKKAVKNIVEDVLKHFPENLLESKISPVHPETLAYTVQYQETAWQFLLRLCSTFGEWLYFDGRSLQVGVPPEHKATSLIFGNNLSRFSVALQANPPGMQVMGYDYINHKIYNSSPAEIEQKAGLNDIGKKVFNASNALYSSTPKSWNSQFFTNQKQLDDLVNMKAGMRSANHVIFQGNSDFPGIVVGGRISVSGQNLFDLANEEFGEYTVISVNHYTDGQGNYSNDFTAVPASIKLAPVKQLLQPFCEAQSAVVTDNYDPKGLSRIRVKFHWMNGAEKTPWIRVSSLHGGGGKGMHFIPEIGEEVLVGFESNLAVKPYVIGTLHNNNESHGFSNNGNDLKVVQTRSGHTIEFNDANDGTHIIIKDPGGNEIYLDTQGKNITITAPETMTLNCRNMNINVQESMMTSIGQNNSQVIGANNTVSVGQNNTQSIGLMNDLAVGGSSMMMVTGDFTEMIQGNLTSETKKDRSEISDAGIEISSSESINKHAQKEIQNNSAENSKVN